MLIILAALSLAACGALKPGSGGNSSAGAAVSEPPVLANPVPRQSPTTAPPPVAAESLEGFWTRFRAAALAGDDAAIRALSAPVVLQNGLLDDTPVVRLPVARVPEVIARIMLLPNGFDAAGRTHRALLEATPTPKRDPVQPRNYHRFGDLVFEHGDGGWRLTELFYEPDE